MFFGRLFILPYCCICYTKCAHWVFYLPWGTRLNEQRLAVTVRQSGFSHAVVEDTAYVGLSDVCGYYFCGIVSLPRAPERRSHWQTISTANIWPRSVIFIRFLILVLIPALLPLHFSTLSLCQRHGGAILPRFTLLISVLPRRSFSTRARPWWLVAKLTRVIGNFMNHIELVLNTHDWIICILHFF